MKISAIKFNTRFISTFQLYGYLGAMIVIIFTMMKEGPLFARDFGMHSLVALLLFTVAIYYWKIMPRNIIGAIKSFALTGVVAFTSEFTWQIVANFYYPSNISYFTGIGWVALIAFIFINLKVWKLDKYFNFRIVLLALTVTGLYYLIWIVDFNMRITIAYNIRDKIWLHTQYFYDPLTNILEIGQHTLTMPLLVLSTHFRREV